MNNETYFSDLAFDWDIPPSKWPIVMQNAKIFSDYYNANHPLSQMCIPDCFYNGDDFISCVTIPTGLNKLELSADGFYKSRPLNIYVSFNNTLSGLIKYDDHVDAVFEHHATIETNILPQDFAYPRHSDIAESMIEKLNSLYPDYDLSLQYFVLQDDGIHAVSEDDPEATIDIRINKTIALGKCYNGMSENRCARLLNEVRQTYYIINREIAGLNAMYKKFDKKNLTQFTNEHRPQKRFQKKEV